MSQYAAPRWDPLARRRAFPLLLDVSVAAGESNGLNGRWPRAAALHDAHYVCSSPPRVVFALHGVLLCAELLAEPVRSTARPELLLCM